MMKSRFLLLAGLLVAISVFYVYRKGKGGVDDKPLTDEQKHLSEHALLRLHATDGLEVKSMATEPMLTNPTNIDVDEKGRVWVTEAYNYRYQINSNATKAEGDRILILEDTDGNGVLDSAKVFYQGPEVNAPLGICVLGNRVIVSQSPYVWDFYDDDGDGHADRKEILFQGIGGEQHDHGVHAVVFGPDGKLYFNFGNSGKTLLDKAGNVVLDQDGDEIGPGKYREGMLFRCNLDGSAVECLGQNFRNPYEATVDSYGNIWQSDNDDDGNKGTRINFIIDYGNYGYADELTGAGWGAHRINMEDSIPQRHWHQNDPGVIPNLLYTGSGSPTGILFYEGSLLPKPFRHQIIHAEPGHNVIRSYALEKSGAGYTAEIVDVLDGRKDQWFRPADICVAPDGSLIIADWYDPGVGGHQVGDLQRGRIYRVSPPKQIDRYIAPRYDLSTGEGAIKALQNPNQSVRYAAFTKLAGMGDRAIPYLEKLWAFGVKPHIRARALWILSKTTKGADYLAKAVKDPNPDLRMTALRAARQLDGGNLRYIRELAADGDIQVRRECALGIRGNLSPEAAELWTKLALQHDGTDKWYLEALGIGAYEQWDRFMEVYLAHVPHPLAHAGARDIIWRSRSAVSIGLLAKLATDAAVPLNQRQRYFRAFAFHEEKERVRTLLDMLERSTGSDTDATFMMLRLLEPKDGKQRPVVFSKAIDEVLTHYAGTQEFLDMLEKFHITDRKQELLDLAISAHGSPLAVNAMRLLLDFDGRTLLARVLATGAVAKRSAIITSLGAIGSNAALGLLSTVVFSETSGLPLRVMAIEAMGSSADGGREIIALLKSDKLPDALVQAVVNGLKDSSDPLIYAEAKSFLPESPSSDTGDDIPRMGKEGLLALPGNTQQGKVLFNSSCSMCHVAEGSGTDFGPNLSEIGSKLPKEAVYNALVNPSAGISFGYETWQVKTKDGATLVGIITSRTEDELVVKYPGGVLQTVKMADIANIVQPPTSLMPNYHDVFTDQEFADILEFLSQLRSQ